MTDISPRDVPLDDDDWVPTEPELEYDNSDELTADHSPIAVEAQEDVPDRVAWSRSFATVRGIRQRTLRWHAL